MVADFYENEEMTGGEKRIGTREAFAKLLPFLQKYRKRLGICLVLLAAATGLSLSWPLLLQKALGGPLKKDKVFYFVSYERNNDRELASLYTTVPTAARTR